MYTTMNQPDVSEKPERPRTSRGRRMRADIPPRPESRRGRQRASRNLDADSESYGRPASRVGFSPDSDYRYSHDAYSRQVTSDGENIRLTDEGGTYIPQNSPADSPVDMYKPQQDVYPRTPPQREVYENSAENPYYGQSSDRDRDEYHHSPQHSYGQDHENLPRSHDRRTTPIDYINVSPIMRDEADDLRHDSYMGEGRSHVSHEPQSQYLYQQDVNQQYHQYIDSPAQRDGQYMGSPSYQDSQYRTSPTREYSPEARYKPPRPKSARPRTGRRKSARIRQKHQDYETSQPQQYDASAILNQGDPYGRPSSSLSRYKPLPAIGATTPRNQVMHEPPVTLRNQVLQEPTTLRNNQASHEPTTMRNQVVYEPPATLRNHVTPEPSPRSSPTKVTGMIGQRMEALTMDEPTQRPRHNDHYHIADSNEGVMTEDLHGVKSDGRVTDNYTSDVIPSVETLTNFPQHLSEEIYTQSLLNFSESQTMDIYEDPGLERKSSSPGKSKTSPLRHKHNLPNEPAPGDPRLLLAIRLPDGSRLQRYFRPIDPLQCVLHFAENTSSEDFSEFHLACNAPKTIFVDLSRSIAETQLQDRTVLYLEEKE